MVVLLLICVTVPLTLLFLFLVRRVRYRDEPLPRHILIITLLTVPAQYLLFLLPNVWQARSSGHFLCDNIPAGLVYPCSFDALLGSITLTLLFGNVMTLGLFFAVTAAGLTLLAALARRLWGQRARDRQR
jgi:hypothetical protein